MCVCVCVCVCVCIIFFVRICIIIVCFTIFEIEYETRSNYRRHIVLLCIILGFIFAIIYSIIIICLFIHRLFYQIMLRKSGLLDCQSRVISNNFEFISFNRRQLKLIEIITKYSVLSLFLIFLSLFGLIIYGIYFGMFANKNRTILFDMLAWSFLGLNLFLNNLILFFYLPFANKYYNKLCLPLHYLCNKCVVFCTKYKQKKIEKSKHYASDTQMVEINERNERNEINELNELNEIKNDTIVETIETIETVQTIQTIETNEKTNNKNNNKNENTVTNEKTTLNDIDSDYSSTESEENLLDKLKIENGIVGNANAMR